MRLFNILALHIFSDFRNFSIDWTMGGLGLRFKKSGLDLCCEIRQSDQLCYQRLNQRESLFHASCKALERSSLLIASAVHHCTKWITVFFYMQHSSKREMNIS